MKTVYKLVRKGLNVEEIYYISIDDETNECIFSSNQDLKTPLFEGVRRSKAANDQNLGTYAITSQILDKFLSESKEGDMWVKCSGEISSENRHKIILSEVSPQPKNVDELKSEILQKWTEKEQLNVTKARSRLPYLIAGAVVLGILGIALIALAAVSLGAPIILAGVIGAGTAAFLASTAGVATAAVIGVGLMGIAGVAIGSASGLTYRSVETNRYINENEKALEGLGGSSKENLDDVREIEISDDEDFSDVFSKDKKVKTGNANVDEPGNKPQ